MRSTLKRYVVLLFVLSFSVLLFSCASTQPGGMGEDSMYADDDENGSQAFDDPSEEEEVLRLLGITDDEAQTSMTSTPASAETSSTRSRTTSPEDRSVDDWQQLEEEISRLENEVSKKDRELASLRAQLSDQENLIQAKQQDLSRINDNYSSTPARPISRQPSSLSPSASAETGMTSFNGTYQEALALYENRRYEEAIGLFRQLLNSGENNTLLDNCQYWIGECYYGMTDYPTALLEFQKVFNYGDSNKLADAQLKTGMCYEKMGNIEQARREYQKMINEYPDSQYISRAQRYLSQL